jgi:hypothetical protein
VRQLFFAAMQTARPCSPPRVMMFTSGLSTVRHSQRSGRFVRIRDPYE